LVGVTVGEAQNPRKTIPRAIKLTFYRILFFYILSIFLLGMIVPYNSPKLLQANKNQTGANASPFVAALLVSGVKTLPGLLNACILLFVFSASNSGVYHVTIPTLLDLNLIIHAKIFTLPLEPSMALHLRGKLPVF
jgi:amino acid transporter